MNKIEVNIYSDFESINSQINAYTIKDSFKYDSTNKEDIKFLDNILVKEISLIRHSKDNDYGFDEQFLEIAINNILVSNKVIIALKMDHSIEPLSKLRSYKGILDKELKSQSKYIEEEVIIEDRQSIIGNLIIVTEKNIVNILDNYFGDSRTCCFFLLENDFNFQNDFLINILKSCVIHNRISVINYFCLCKLLKRNEQIIRIGGDGFDEVSIQIFSLKEQ